MFRIRYYDQVMHPDHFKGFLGGVIRALNFIRWRLETLIQLLVLRYLSNEGALPKAKRVELRRMFDLDVSAEKLEKEQTSPLVPKVERNEAPRAERYQAGAQTTAFDVAHAVENDLPARPKKMDNMIAAYGGGRERSYSRGRRFTADPEGDFEPMEDGS
jgi:hypothetical protein